MTDYTVRAVITVSGDGIDRSKIQSLLDSGAKELPSVASRYGITVSGVEATIDELGNVSGRRYDDFGNLTRLTAPDGAKWDFSYDALSRLTATTDPAARARPAGTRRRGAGAPPAAQMPPIRSATVRGSPFVITYERPDTASTRSSAAAMPEAALST